MNHKASIVIAGTLFCASTYVNAMNVCFDEVGQYYNIDPMLLRSIAKVESNFQKDAININKDASGKELSRDFGIMQINQFHVPSLIQKKIIKSEEELITDPCLNIQIGAWILYTHFRKCGTNWQCVGTYNTGFSGKNEVKKRQYMVKVYNVYTELYSKAEQRAKGSSEH